MKKIKTGDQNLVKTINKSIVFELIVKKGPVSRAQISKDAGLTRATVSTMVTELIDEEFVYEIGEGQSSGGRKPVMLYFNHHAGFSIGIDLGVNYILGILTDLSGRVIVQIDTPLKDTALNSVKEQLFSVIEKLIEEVPDSKYGIVGIGLGIPGMIDQEDKILFAPNLKWTNVDLKQVIEDRFHIPVKIENEANAGSLGERLYGIGKDIPNQIYLSIGIGIGTGITIQNQLYTGSSGIAGEMGHFTIESNGKKCSCGNRGCWELYASESALRNTMKQQKVFGEDRDIELEELVQEARKGNSKVLQALNTVGEYIGIGLISIVNTFNPQLIIIGNRMSLFEDWLMNPINRILEERLNPHFYKTTKVCFSALGKNSIAMGASSISISEFFKRQNLKVN